MTKLPNIQILRAVAALIVVIYHCAIETTTVCGATGTGCKYVFWPGGYGVALFFVISGFIMVATSWNSFNIPGASFNFIKRRILRIVPLYWILTTVATIGVFFIPSMLKVPVFDVGYIIASYLFWPVVRVNGFVRPIANLGWTLNIEMMFYAVFAVGLFFRRETGIALTIAFLGLFTLLQTLGLFAPGGAFAAVPLNFWADPIILNFIVGMIAATYYKQLVRLNAYQAGLLFAAVVVLVFFIHQYDYILDTYREDYLISRLGDAVPAMVLFIAAAFGPQVNIGNYFWRAAHLLGDASYSLYLVHPFLLRSFTKIWIKLVGDHLPPWMFGIACLVFAIAGGLATYFAIEQPMVKYFGSKKKTALPPEPAIAQV
jgi:exopolysaccharide production protein ExoZ